MKLFKKTSKPLRLGYSFAGNLNEWRYLVMLRQQYKLLGLFPVYRNIATRMHNAPRKTNRVWADPKMRLELAANGERLYLDAMKEHHG